MDWFLYYHGFRHERVKSELIFSAYFYAKSLIIYEFIVVFKDQAYVNPYETIRMNPYETTDNNNKVSAFC